MLQNKLKTIAALSLTVIFLLTISFANVTFAASTSDGQETIMEGVYYIRNEVSNS